jgi:hypothetical protein
LHKRQQGRQDHEPHETHETREMRVITDPLLGRCDVTMPLEHTCGTIRCVALIDGSECEVSGLILDSLERAVAELKQFWPLITNPEQIKVCRNALLEQLPAHQVMCPKIPLSPEDMKAKAQLRCVRVSPDDVDFQFFHRVFLEGGTIIVTVDPQGKVIRSGMC